jgi:hypothetical protein
MGKFSFVVTITAYSSIDKLLIAWYLISSFRSSPVDCSGITVFFFPPRGRVELLSFCCDVMSYAVLCGYRGFLRQMAPYVYDVSREGDSDSVESGEKSFFVRPAGNRGGNLSLMRRVWYHKTTASANGTV